jgi:ribosomal subunit interface protein
MDVIVKGRHTDVNDRFRRHVGNKVAKIEKLDPKVIRVDVEVSEEHNPRQADRRERVELTIHSRGPVIRAEAAADDRYVALDVAIGKLESRLRRMCDRRKGHSSSHGRVRLAMALAPDDELPTLAEDTGADGAATVADSDDDAVYGGEDPEGNIVPIPMEGDGPVILREKFHKADPMTVDQAMLEMELVGHDFFLYRDKESGHSSVVYRRRGWDYGVIRLVEE